MHGIETIRAINIEAAMSYVTKAFPERKEELYALRGDYETLDKRIDELLEYVKR